MKRVKKRYPFDGQTQKYFLVRLKDKAKIDLNAFSVPEFDDYDFVEYNEVFKRASYFKKQIYRRVINYFIKEGYIEYVVGS
jgi:putative (di)nucleoside polyphosphate hydrolase